MAIVSRINKYFGRGLSRLGDYDAGNVRMEKPVRQLLSSLALSDHQGRKRSVFLRERVLRKTWSPCRGTD